MKRGRLRAVERARRRCAPLTWMRPCSRWNPAGRPRASSATISPSMSSGASKRRASGSSARTTAGNCAVFSLPSRDQSRMSGRGLPGATWTSARMPSYFGSKISPLPVERRLGQRRQHRADAGGVVAPGGHLYDHMHRQLPTPNSQLQRTPNPPNSQGPGVQLPDLDVWRACSGRWELGAGWDLGVGAWDVDCAFLRRCAESAASDR